MNIVKTASATAKLGFSGSDTLTTESFPNLINAYVDEVMEMTFGNPDDEQLKKLFRQIDQKNELYKIKTKNRPGGTVPLSRDADDVTFIQAGEGFPYEFRVYGYRQAVKHERSLQEVDDVGVITDRYEWLMDNAKRTLKNAYADVFNRAIKPTNAPFLCPDGMYLIDAARPNPDPKVPNWSNEEADSAITDEALFTAQLNAHNTIGPNGDYLRLKIAKILIPQKAEKKMWTLLNSQNIVASAANDANWANGRFKYEVLDELTVDSIFYVLGDTQSKDNGLQCRWRIKPEMKDMEFENPDVMGKRIRFAFGLGSLDPRYTWRGGLVTGL